jgi:hypothetical protein
MGRLPPTDFPATIGRLPPTAGRSADVPQVRSVSGGNEREARHLAGPPAVWQRGVSRLLPPTAGRLPPTSGRLPPTEGRLPPTEGRLPPTEGRLPPTIGRWQQHAKHRSAATERPKQAAPPRRVVCAIPRKSSHLSSDDRARPLVLRLRRRVHRQVTWLVRRHSRGERACLRVCHRTLPPPPAAGEGRPPPGKKGTSVASGKARAGAAGAALTIGVGHVFLLQGGALACMRAPSASGRRPACAAAPPARQAAYSAKHGGALPLDLADLARPMNRKDESACIGHGCRTRVRVRAARAERAAGGRVPGAAASSPRCRSGGLRRR